MNSYDEFSFLSETAEEFAIDWDGSLTPTRRDLDVGGGRAISVIVWERSEPSYVFLHGGRQNAHTWDATILALNHSAIAIDMANHGQSDDAKEPMDVMAHAEDAAKVIEQLAQPVDVVVGMSLGGLVSIALAASRPELVPRLVIVDVTPGVQAGRSRTVEMENILATRSFATFDELLAESIRANPDRSEKSLRRGLLHNTRQREDGRWVWRWDRSPNGFSRRGDGAEPAVSTSNFSQLWDALSTFRCPVMLLQGAQSRVIDENDLAEFKRRLPRAEFHRVEGAGHSIQGNQPVELACLIQNFVASSRSFPHA